jgi:hypothetical protein
MRGGFCFILILGFSISQRAFSTGETTLPSSNRSAENISAIKTHPAANPVNTGENELPEGINDPPFLNSSYPWVDSLMNTLTLEQKIAQLILVDAYSANDNTNSVKVEE